MALLQKPDGSYKNTVHKARSYKEGESWIKRKPKERVYVYAIKKDFVTKGEKGIEINYKHIDPVQSGWYGPKEYGKKKVFTKAWILVCRN